VSGYSVSPLHQAPPLRVEIVNAEALKPDQPETRRIDVERDSSGKLTGAVVTDA